MGRNKTNTVDYFPHIAKPGKTLFILEGQFGNDGYAFWFKLLEILSSTENHFYDASKITEWHYLVGRARITPETATEILNLVADMGNIDDGLWRNHKIIWCEALLDNLSEVYRKRKRPLPNKPICDRNMYNCDRNNTNKGISATESTQSRVEESRVDKSRENKTTLVPPKRGNGVEEEFEKWWKAYPPRRKTGKPAAKAKWIYLQKIGRLLPLENMLEVLEAQKQSQDWIKEAGEYIPGPHPYLNQFKFLDESISPTDSKSSRKRPVLECPRCRGSGTYQSGKAPDESPVYSPCNCKEV